jgi:transcriptional regulator with XRE-family HTH domain
MLDVQKIKQLREKLELTQEQAAMKAGLKTRQRWNAIESGREASINLVTLGKVAKALGVKAKDLLK